MTFIGLDSYEETLSKIPKADLTSTLESPPPGSSDDDHDDEYKNPSGIAGLEGHLFRYASGRMKKRQERLRHLAE